MLALAFNIFYRPSHPKKSGHHVDGKTPAAKPRLDNEIAFLQVQTSAQTSTYSPLAISPFHLIGAGLACCFLVMHSYSKDKCFDR